MVSVALIFRKYFVTVYTTAGGKRCCQSVACHFGSV